MSVLRIGFWMVSSVTMGLTCTGCSGQAGSALENRAAAPAVEQPRAVSAPPSAAARPAPLASVAPVAAAVAAVARSSRAASAPLKVKRWVVASGVQDREPVTTAEPMPADGTPIYAFAELSNAEGSSENVRITFERKGGKERAGDVLLPVPGNVTRHRTWAFTRHIFAPGQWEAVLRTESGVELGRTSFDVKQG